MVEKARTLILFVVAAVLVAGCKERGKPNGEESKPAPFPFRLPFKDMLGLSKEEILKQQPNLQDVGLDRDGYSIEDGSSVQADLQLREGRCTRESNMYQSGWGYQYHWCHSFYFRGNRCVQIRISPGIAYTQNGELPLAEAMRFGEVTDKPAASLKLDSLKFIPGNPYNMATFTHTNAKIKTGFTLVGKAQNGSTVESLDRYYVILYGLTLLD
jgi:hypothetical protein